MLPYLLFACLPATLTMLLPARWLLLWLPFFWGGTICLAGPVFAAGEIAVFSAAVVFSPLWLVNGMATAARLAILVTDLIVNMDRGY